MQLVAKCCFLCRNTNSHAQHVRHATTLNAGSPVILLSLDIAHHCMLGNAIDKQHTEAICTLILIPTFIVVTLRMSLY